MASPASGELLPFGYQVIEITGHSDIWGEYRDLLICKVSVTQESRYIYAIGFVFRKSGDWRK